MTSFTRIRAASLAAGLMVIAGPGVALAQVAVSDLPEIVVTETTKLPEGPFSTSGNDDCQGNYAEPETEAGLYVQEHGWGVISEATLGDYQLVSFAGEFVTGTSGSCAIEQSNIGVFEGGDLNAIFYTANKTDQLIGVLDGRQNGSVRIWGGDFVSLPVGDISITDTGLVVGPVAAEETYCGAAVVPNIYDAPITEARKTLKTAGWKPVPQPREEFGQQGDLHDIGITEAETCSGTGFGFCRYNYRSAGALLDVTTVGEFYEDSVPSVVDYAVTCAN
ncbi:hypothetical protein [Devosia riboflavina]